MPLSAHSKTKLFSATPEQRAKIAQATANANRLENEIIENATAFIISGLLIWGAWELSSRVDLFKNYVTDWISPLAYKNAINLLQSAKDDNARLFARNDIFGMYKRFHPALLALNAEMNAIPDEVYVNMEPHLQNLLTIIGTQDKGILRFFITICLRSANKARLEADLYTLGGIIVTVPFLQKLFVDLFLTKIFSRSFHYVVRRPSQKWLNRVSADELITELIRANSQNKIFEKIIFHGMHIFTFISLAFIVADITYAAGILPPIFIIWVAACLIIAIKNMYLNYFSWRAEIHLQKTLDEVYNNFESALADFGELYLLEKGAILSECYLNFTANSIDRNLSIKLVNRAVKDVLVKNNISISEYDNATITLEAQRLTNDVIIRVKKQIHSYLQYHKNIKKLRRQIESFFGIDKSVMEIFLKGEDVPYALIEINRTPACYKLDVFKKLFPGNRITISEFAIEIEGNKPSEKFIDYGSGLSETIHSLTSESSIVSVKRSSSAKISRSLASQTPVPIAPLRVNPVERQHWHTESADYDTQDGNVFPMQSKEEAYVMFALPLRLFPTEKCYQQFKTKVESGRKASNDKGKQGLQVRQERVRDDTLPHRPFFLSHLRCKLLGKWGDMRVHAEKLVNEKDAILYRFCSFDPANH